MRYYLKFQKDLIITSFGKLVIVSLLNKGICICVADYQCIYLKNSWKITPDVNEVKRLLIKTVDHLESDLESGVFVNYEPFELPIGFRVKDHVQALQAANYHEAEHSGKISTYLKLLVKE